MVMPSNKKLIESWNLTIWRGGKIKSLEDKEDIIGKNKKYIVRITAEDSAMAEYSIMFQSTHV